MKNSFPESSSIRPLVSSILVCCSVLNLPAPLAHFIVLFRSANPNSVAAGRAALQYRRIIHFRKEIDRMNRMNRIPKEQNENGLVRALSCKSCSSCPKHLLRLRLAALCFLRFLAASQMGGPPGGRDVEPSGTKWNWRSRCCGTGSTYRQPLTNVRALDERQNKTAQRQQQKNHQD
jgi:hypothetical protein